jgi:hypothetical protein
MWAGSRLEMPRLTPNLGYVSKKQRSAYLRRFFTLLTILAASAGILPKAYALTGTEGFPASAPGGITSSLASITDGGTAITRSSATQCFASWGTYGGFTGLVLHLYGVRNDITFTFSSSEFVTAFSFKAQAVNGIQLGRITYENGSTSQFNIPDTIALQTISVAGNGNRIKSFSIIGTPSGVSCNGSGTASGDNDYWILDDISWTYTAYAPDTTPPTFPSPETFNVNENSTSVGTIQASESSTISIFDGADKLKFSLSRLSESSSSLSFITAPNFEAPTDADMNNSYIVVLRGVDTALNVGYETITVTVIDVLDIATFNSLGLDGGATTATFRSSINISANLTLPSKVTFLANGKRITGCIKISSSGASPNIVAICSWKPTNRGSISLTAISYPTNQSFTGVSSTATNIVVGTRTGTR